MENKQEKRMLSEHFALSEMVRSGTAIRYGIDNTPTEEAIENFTLLCRNVLEPLRRRFGAVRITSGYRSQALNRAVGGARTSQHLTGEAADIHISNEEAGRRMYDFICRHTDFDQLLFERRPKTSCCWLHVSYTARRPNRRQASQVIAR